MKQTSKSKTTVNVENLHQIFIDSPSVQKILKESDKILANLKLPPRQTQVK